MTVLKKSRICGNVKTVKREFNLKIGKNLLGQAMFYLVAKVVCKRFLESGMTPEQVAERMDVPIKFVNACIH